MQSLEHTRIDEQADPITEPPEGEAIELRLLRDARSGDPYAFESLQQHLEPPIRRFIRRLIGIADAEDDIVQDVFIALFYKMHRIDPIENVRPYVFRMARNRCYDELRAQGRFDPISLDDDGESLWVSFTSATDVESQPEEVAHWLLMQLEVREAMERLPELQRQTLMLYSEENLSYAEIAIAMDTNIGTVKSRLHHAKKTLAGLLKPDTLRALQLEFGGSHV
ncbi:MAG TPA: RNA polymerase sigma factor [Aggregatilineales bacterium]|nr:RNA polymerase sigma factor [Aggregatilineales bacterium]